MSLTALCCCDSCRLKTDFALTATVLGPNYRTVCYHSSHSETNETSWKVSKLLAVEIFRAREPTMLCRMKSLSGDGVDPLTMVRFTVMCLPQTQKINRATTDIPLEDRNVTRVRSVFGHRCHSSRTLPLLKYMDVCVCVCVCVCVFPTVHARRICVYGCTHVNSVYAS